MLKKIKKTALFSLLATALLGGSFAQAEEIRYPLRSDEGMMSNFRPMAISFLDESLWGQTMVLITDSRYNTYHIFDLTGRRFRFLKNRNTPASYSYSGMTPLGDNQYMVTGNHYQEQNRRRITLFRSFMGILELDGEEITEDSLKTNYSPLSALRRTGLFGTNPDNKEPIHITSMASDQRSDRIFWGLEQPLSPEGTIQVLTTQLSLLLKNPKNPNLPLSLIDTGIQPSVDPKTGNSYELAGMTEIENQGIVLLLSTQEKDNLFGTNQLWFLPHTDVAESAVLLDGDIGAGNKGTGIASYQEADGSYTFAIVCDNNPKFSKKPSMLILSPGHRF